MFNIFLFPKIVAFVR